MDREPDPPQSGSSSSATIQLMPPSGTTAAIAERYMAFLKKMSRKSVCSSPGVAMNGNTERPVCFADRRVLQGSLARVPDLGHALDTVQSVN